VRAMLEQIAALRREGTRAAPTQRSNETTTPSSPT
jgi:hypothetical protein